MDGAYDFSVFGHEFGHLIENRMIGKGVGARQGTHAGSMGEAFGDFDALEVMNALHLAPVPRLRPSYTEGAYATGNPLQRHPRLPRGPADGRRRSRRPSQNPDTDPLNYGDFGFDIVGTEVHADGEIWVAVEIDLRDLFLATATPSERGRAQDVACARGQTAPDHVPGRPALDPGLLRLDGDHAAGHDDDPGPRRHARRRPRPAFGGAQPAT